MHTALRPQILNRVAMRSTGLSHSAPLASASRTGTSESKRTLFNMTQRGKIKQLKSLEHDANLHPEDAFRQTRFLQELNKNYPALVIRRIEENRFAVDETVQKEYIKALVKCVIPLSLDLPLLLSVTPNGLTDGFLYQHSLCLHCIGSPTPEPAASTLSTCRTCSRALSALVASSVTAAVACPSTVAAT